jgi:fatty-acyl-CoA synthase
VSVRRATDLGALLAEVAAGRGDALAVTDDRIDLSYAELDRLSSRVAAGLVEAGVHPGDRVAMLAPNSINWIASVFGIARVGAMMVGVSTWYDRSTLGYVLAHAGARAVIGTTSFRDRDYLADVTALAESGELPELRAIVSLDEAGRAPTAPEGISGLDWPTFVSADAREFPAVDGTSPAYLLYTSGSTGKPKGVLLRHDGLIHNSYWAAEALGIDADDRVYLGVPLCFAFGCIQALLGGFSRGAAIVLQEKFDAAGALRLIERHGCTVWFGVPKMARDLAQLPDFSRERIRTLQKGRAGHAVEDMLYAVEELGIAELCAGYGMTELYGPCALARHDASLEDRMANRCTLLDGVEIRIVDPETEQTVPATDEGEIRVRSRFPYSGYFRDEALNAACFDDGGFFRTGDRGLLDDQGRVSFTGRYKNVIKSNGLNISPEHIEQVLLGHELVIEACVFAVPDRVRGEAPAAVVVVREAVDAERLQAWSASRLESYQQPLVLVQTEELPKLSGQKIDRLTVQRRATAELAGKQAIPHA